MIKVTNISKNFGSLSVLKNINMKVENGQIYGLVGYNGVGKTTLMKIICGIYRPDMGKVWMDDKILYENAEKKSDCFFMTEEISSFSEFTLNDMRKFYKGYYPLWSDEIYKGLLEAFSMDSNVKLGQFSKGMQRQAGLVLAFSSNVNHMFLDEAFDGLDFGIRRQVRYMMQNYVKERNACILVSSHNLNELEELADHIGMLSDGEIIFDDSTANMGEAYQVCRVYKESVLDKFLHNNKDVSWLKDKDNVNSYIINGTKEDAFSLIENHKDGLIEVRHIKLEEFFQKERYEKEIDWSEIFKK